MNDAKTPPDWVAEKDDQPLSPSTLYDPMPRADLTVPPMMHPGLTRLHAEIARLQAELSEERDESLWRFWSERANKLSTKNVELRAALDAMTAERDSLVATRDMLIKWWTRAQAGRDAAIITAVSLADDESEKALVLQKIDTAILRALISQEDKG